MEFNIANALKKLETNAKPTSVGKCASFVRTAMEAGGLSTIGRPNWAWEYINWLPTQGWSLVKKCGTLQEQLDYNTKLAQPGDVAVYQKPGCGTTQPGHICMWSGKMWISDFRQNKMNVYSGNTPIYVFRYTGKISNEKLI